MLFLPFEGRGKMILNLLGKKNEVVKDGATGERLFQFDEKGQHKMNTVFFTPMIIQKVLRKFKHDVVNATTEEKEMFSLTAPVEKQPEPKQEEIKTENKPVESNVDYEAMKEIDLRQLAKKLKIRSFHNKNLNKLITEIKEKQNGIS